MTKTNYNLFVIFFSSLFIIAYMFFYDFSKEHYYSSPEFTKSGDLEIKIELIGTPEQLFGRLRKKFTSPYKLKVNLISDIPMETITFIKVNVVDSNENKTYSFLADQSPETVEFDELDQGAELEYTFGEQWPIPFNSTPIQIEFVFETTISGNKEFHEFSVMLVPSVTRDIKFLTPEEARKVLNN